jgi:hypothetical protein
MWEGKGRLVLWVVDEEHDGPRAVVGIQRGHLDTLCHHINETR